MHFDRDSWIDKIKVIAKKFVKNNYSEELSLFDTFWQVLSPKINEVIKSNDVGDITFKRINQIVAEVSFAKDNALDLMTPIIIGAITEVLFQVRTKKISTSELEKIIGTAAVRQGAKPSLTACLIRNIPILYNDLLHTKDNASEATVSIVIPQYRIWTKGKKEVVKSIDKFEKNKARYLLWIDLDEKHHISSINPKLRIAPQTVKLLVYLVERLGTPVPTKDILKDVFEAGSREIGDSDINNIEQNLTRLQKFCNGKFRQYLFSNHRKGYGLKDSFADKYFLFERLS